MKIDTKGQWALITGASGGMGADFARQLGEMGMNLVLTARRSTELEALKVEILKKTPSVEIRILPGDLTSGTFREKLFQDTQDLPLLVLINNAGFGAHGAFDTIDWAKEELMLDLDIKALVHLTRTYAQRMKNLKKGYILQVASIAAFQPCPLYASYGAAKAFVLSYGIAVRTELRKTGVSVTVLNPGVTATAFFEVAENHNLSKYQKASMMSSPKVVKGAIKALFKKKPLYVPGLLNRLSAHSTRLITRLSAARIAQNLMKSD